MKMNREQLNYFRTAIRRSLLKENIDTPLPSPPQPSGLDYNPTPEFDPASTPQYRPPSPPPYKPLLPPMTVPDNITPTKMPTNAPPGYGINNQGGSYYLVDPYGIPVAIWDRYPPPFDWMYGWQYFR